MISSKRSTVDKGYSNYVNIISDKMYDEDVMYI